MKTTFFEECGENVEPLSDLGARFQAVASELFSISCYGDFILKQAFPQTATGEYLDYHAGLKGIIRKTATKAKGTLTFYIAQVMSSDVEIPKGTICAVKDSPYIQFETDEPAVITAGSTSVDVKATAISVGSDANVGASTITVMVNPPRSVIAVNNQFSFDGGYLGESDRSLRKRVLGVFSIPQTGLGISMLENAVLDIDEILDCKIVKGGSSYINTYVKARTVDVSYDLKKLVRNALGIMSAINYSISVYGANKKEFNLFVQTCADENVDEKIKALAREYCSCLRIGESLNLNQLEGEITAIDGVKYCKISCDTAFSDMVKCNNDQYLSLSNVRVTYVE